jgi:hypothetical protein
MLLHNDLRPGAVGDSAGVLFSGVREGCGGGDQIAGEGRVHGHTALGARDQRRGEIREGKTGVPGGRCRDRTCDPLGVNEMLYR